MTQEYAEIAALAPTAPDWRIDWAAVRRTALGRLAEQMENTPQDARWHGEGNVWNHVRLVCESLVSMRDYRAMDRRTQEILFFSVLLHDIGKVQTTGVEDGRIRARKHGEVGSRMARAFLWTQCGLSGTSEKMILRETICRMIRYHMAPPHMLYGDTYRVRVPRIAAGGELTPDFTLRRLALLSEADNRGRICDDLAEQLALIEASGAFAKELGCFDAPARFEDARAQRAFFAGRGEQADAADGGARSEVILLCGLSGRARARWTAQHGRELRAVSPEDERSAQTIEECAKAHLDARCCFIWNATNLTADERGALTERYELSGARVSIVYVEDAQEGCAAPELISRLSVPERHEAERVAWVCI